MSAGVPMELTEIGEPEDVAALVVYLLSDRAREERITGQVYTVAGPKIAVWAQPRELRSAYAEEGWTPERIAEVLPGSVGVDPMPMLERVEGMAGRRRLGSGRTPRARVVRWRWRVRVRSWLLAQFPAVPGDL